MEMKLIKSIRKVFIFKCNDVLKYMRMMKTLLKYKKMEVSKIKINGTIL